MAITYNDIIKHGHCLLIHGLSVFFVYILDSALLRHRHRLTMYQWAVTMIYLQSENILRIRKIIFPLQDQACQEVGGVLGSAGPYGPRISELP